MSSTWALWRRITPLFFFVVVRKYTESVRVRSDEDRVDHPEDERGIYCRHSQGYHTLVGLPTGIPNVPQKFGKITVHPQTEDLNLKFEHLAAVQE